MYYKDYSITIIPFKFSFFCFNFFFNKKKSIKNAINT